jgi:hypothetical protein
MNNLHYETTLQGMIDVIGENVGILENAIKKGWGDKDELKERRKFLKKLR